MKIKIPIVMINNHADWDKLLIEEIITTILKLEGKTWQIKLLF